MIGAQSPVIPITNFTPWWFHHQKQHPISLHHSFCFSLFLGWVLLPVHFFGGVVFVFLLCTKQCVFFAVGPIKKKQMGDLFCHFELNDNVVHPLFREVTANGKSTWKWLGGEHSVQDRAHAVAIREEIIDCFNGCAIKSVDTFLKSKPWENLPFYKCGDCTDRDVMIVDDCGGVVPLKRTNTEPMYGTVQYEAFVGIRCYTVSSWVPGMYHICANGWFYTCIRKPPPSLITGQHKARRTKHNKIN